MPRRLACLVNRAGNESGEDVGYRFHFEYRAPQDMKVHKKYVRVLCVVTCAAAAFISYKLLAKHVTNSSGSAWFDAGCSDDPQPGGANCAAVLASPYSYFPPKKESDPPNLPHVPVAFLGLVYYSALAVWTAGIGAPSPQRRWLHVLVLLSVGFGLAWSARFVYLMFATLNQWCLWCMFTHFCNALIALCLILLWPRRTKTPARGVAQREPLNGAPPCHPPPVHPSWSRMVGTFAAMAVVLYGNLGASAMLTSKKTAGTLHQCLDALYRVQGDTERLVKMWSTAPTQPIVIRPDDPIRAEKADASRSIDLVVFSDFACPSCSRFADVLDRDIAPLFGGRLRVVFKHYPIDRDCNPVVATTMHPHACRATRLAEAARLQSNEAFWKVHDLLFERRRKGDDHATLDPTEVAGVLDLNAGQLTVDSAGDVVSRRIAEDAELAKTCQIHGTPAVFLDARRVDPLAVLDLRFWDLVASKFREESGEEKPRASESLKSKPPMSNP